MQNARRTSAEAFTLGCHGLQRLTQNANAFSVMAGLVPAIHVFWRSKNVDARHKAGHDNVEISARIHISDWRQPGAHMKKGRSRCSGLS
jgi:hypothetical protein